MNFNRDNPVYLHNKAIDFRHARALATIVSELCPRHVLEIGAFQGASTMAFLEALDQCAISRLSLCDMAPQPCLLDLVRPYGTNVDVYPYPSNDPRILALAPDFVFIDGDHRGPGLDDIAFQQTIGTPIIAVHDVHNLGETSCPEWAWGTVSGAMRLVQAYPFHLLDNKRRMNERTERGLLIAFKETPTNADELRAIWAKACG